MNISSNLSIKVDNEISLSTFEVVISFRVDVYRRRKVLFSDPFLFFFTNDFFWDVLGYEDGVLKSWLGACLKGLLIVHGMTKPKF